MGLCDFHEGLGGYPYHKRTDGQQSGRPRRILETRRLVGALAVRSHGKQIKPYSFYLLGVERGAHLSSFSFPFSVFQCLGALLICKTREGS